MKSLITFNESYYQKQRTLIFYHLVRFSVDEYTPNDQKFKIPTGTCPTSYNEEFTKKNKGFYD